MTPFLNDEARVLRIDGSVLRKRPYFMAATCKGIPGAVVLLSFPVDANALCRSFSKCHRTVDGFGRL